MVSSRIALGYPIISHPSSGAVAISAFTAGFIPTVADESAPARNAVPLVGEGHGR